MIQNTREFFRKFTDDETFDKIVEYPDVVTMWNRCAEEYGERIAIVDDGVERTFSQIDEDISFFRAVLNDCGAKKGDRVALFAKNRILNSITRQNEYGEN